MASKNTANRCSRLNSLHGVEIVGHSVEATYWHLYVYLQTANGRVIWFFNHPTNIAKMFEVFPIDFEFLQSSDRDFTALMSSFTVNRTQELWRVEWSEIALPHPKHQGTNPVSITGGPLGTAARNSIEQCDVFAGVSLQSTKAKRIAVYTPTDTPLNTNIALTTTEIERLIPEFSLV